MRPAGIELKQLTAKTSYCACKAALNADVISTLLIALIFEIMTAQGI